MCRSKKTHIPWEFSKTCFMRFRDVVQLNTIYVNRGLAFQLFYSEGNTIKHIFNTYNNVENKTCSLGKYPQMYGHHFPHSTTCLLRLLGHGRFRSSTWARLWGNLRLKTVWICEKTLLFNLGLYRKSATKLKLGICEEYYRPCIGVTMLWPLRCY